MLLLIPVSLITIVMKMLKFYLHLMCQKPPETNISYNPNYCVCIIINITLIKLKTYGMFSLGTKSHIQREGRRNVGVAFSKQSQLILATASSQLYTITQQVILIQWFYMCRTHSMHHTPLVEPTFYPIKASPIHFLISMYATKQLINIIVYKDFVPFYNELSTGTFSLRIVMFSFFNVFCKSSNPHTDSMYY